MLFVFVSMSICFSCLYSVNYDVLYLLVIHVRTAMFKTLFVVFLDCHLWPKLVLCLLFLYIYAQN